LSSAGADFGLLPQGRKVEIFSKNVLKRKEWLTILRKHSSDSAIFVAVHCGLEFKDSGKLIFEFQGQDRTGCCRFWCFFSVPL
jgi:hypothetical protein